ncbi:Cytochrome P450 [Tylopilus felleus]
MLELHEVVEGSMWPRSRSKAAIKINLKDRCGFQPTASRLRHIREECVVGWNHCVVRDIPLLDSNQLIVFSCTAGAETASSAMAWFVFAFVLHPDVQKRAQAELDTVVGRSRPPSFSDFENLPYIRALVKEVLCWHTVDPELTLFPTSGT